MTLQSKLSALKQSRRRIRHNKRGETSLTHRRRVFFERLEDRRLLASDWTNPVLAGDVNDDGYVTALDSLVVMNHLNRTERNANGLRPLPELSAGERPENFYDTSGDGFVSALDAIAPINAQRGVVTRLRSVMPTSSTSILLTFGDAVPQELVDPANFSVKFCSNDVPCSAGNMQTVEIRSATLSADATQVTLVTRERPIEGDLFVSASGAEGESIDATAVLSFSSSLPRVVGAVSTSNTTVLVSFSEDVKAAAAENAQSYVIGQKNVNSEAGTLIVKEARFASATDHSNVILTTWSQNELTYELNVVGIVDESNNALAAPVTSDGVLVDPTRVLFPGTPPMGPSLVDSDGDGLSDNEEQRGWIVNVEMLDKTIVSRVVTSDPKVKDTDGDGLEDNKEAEFGLDPRDKDTDDDNLDDNQEANVVYSDFADQDTDDDGLSDGLEHNFFKTSALLADTDGDQFTDDQEIITDVRSPRLADLPRVDILTGNVDLRLDVRFEEQNSKGTTTLESKTVTTSLQQSEESSRSRENSSTKEWFAKVGVCGGAACASDGGILGFAKAGFMAEAGGGGSSTATFSTASSKASQREHASSLATDKEASAESTVVRNVEGATMGVEVNLANTGNLSFSIRNIEITALIQDLGDPTKFVPVATLFPASDAPISIGPLSPERGPFRFEAKEALPELVDSLMQNPRGLFFQVANYDITDEVGRNFSFVEQDVNDRTAFLEIDYSGNLTLEKHQVATNSEFDPDGNSKGLRMKDMMQDILGLKFIPENADSNLTDAERDVSYSTRTIDGVEVLSRVKRVERDFDDAESRQWWVLTPNGQITPSGDSLGSNFHDQVLFAGQDFAFKFVQDLDGDRLEASQEFIYRSSDSLSDTTDDDDLPDSKDTDNDGIDDGDEVYGFLVNNESAGFTIQFDDGQDSYKTSSNPGRADSDNDGLTDCQELSLCDISVWLDEDGIPSLEQPTFEDGSKPDPISTFRLGELLGNPLIVDDGNSQFTSAAETLDVGFGNDSRFAIAASENREFASWRFTGLTAGTYIAATTWTEGNDRGVVPFQVFVEDVLQKEVRLDQSLAPNDFNTDSADFEQLGNRAYTVPAGGTLIVKALTTTDENKFAIADAVRLERAKLTITDPSKADTDGDGLTDGKEVAGFRFRNLLNTDDITLKPRESPADTAPATNPLSRDTDGDTLSDFQETLLGTNPTVNDGDDVLDDDGDGLTNLQENTPRDVEWVQEKVTIFDEDAPEFVRISTDPPNTNCPDGFNGSCFSFENDAQGEWRIGGLENGLYHVSVTYPTREEAADAKYTLTTGASSETIAFDQSGGPENLEVESVKWDILRSQFRVTNGFLNVKVEKDDSTEMLPLFVDAIRLVRAETVTKKVDSDPNDPDSDDDGLTDWEEFTGCRDVNGDRVCDSETNRLHKTNPLSNDTDMDGLTDLQEVEGIPFAGGTDNTSVITNPLHYDTDVDARSDADEFNTPWIVRVERKVQEEVFSDPTKADADGDGLKDGEEISNGTHPRNADTDGDKALDGDEVLRRDECDLRNSIRDKCVSKPSPLNPDRLVTVTFVSLTVGKGVANDDADGDNNSAGDWEFALNIHLPDGDQDTVVDRTNVNLQLNTGESNETALQYSFAVGFTQQFAFEGFAFEFDSQLELLMPPAPVQNFPNGRKDVTFDFGGFTDSNAVFAGANLEVGAFPVTFSGKPNDTSDKEIPVEVVILVTVE